MPSLTRGSHNYRGRKIGTDDNSDFALDILNALLIVQPITLERKTRLTGLLFETKHFVQVWLDDWLDDCVPEFLFDALQASNVSPSCVWNARETLLLQTWSDFLKI